MSLPAIETKNDAQPAAEVEEQAGFRVYLGNLPFSTNEEQIREFLGTSGGKILTIIIPKRFDRPAGFGFVHFETEDGAKNAVEKLNETELGERKVTLQVARSKEEQAERREAAVARRDAARAAREADKSAGATEGEAVDGEVKPRKKRSSKPQKREPRRRLPEEAEDGAEVEAEAPGEVSESAEKPKRKPRARKPREARIDGAEGAEVESKPNVSREPRERRERKPRLELTGEQSQNTVFVANLPFNVDDQGLSDIFTNLSIRVKSAKVVVGLRRGRGGRPFRASRGFGFVEVEDVAQQKEAVEKVEGSLIGDRKLSAKVANEMKPIEMADVAEAGKIDGTAVPVAA